MWTPFGISNSKHGSLGGRRASTATHVAAIVAIGAVLGTTSASAQEIHGFVEGLSGVRTAQGSGFESGGYTAQEVRLQIQIGDYSDQAEYFARVDLPLDQLDSAGGGNARTSQLELREAYFTYTGFGSSDLKIGRQMLTWGTGDLLFINDVFPRDWESFFIGRETQYLKAPMDAARIGVYTEWFNLSVVAMPRFEPDRLPAAERLAFYNPMGEVEPVEPDMKISNAELAARADRTVGSTEIALYGYRGFFRQPVGFDVERQQPFYPRLNVYGASARRGLFGGIFNLEAGYYDSRDDPSGTNPLVENSSAQAMGGYDRQLWTDFQLGAQAYFEWMANHDGYVNGLPPGAFERRELHQLYTLRLTQMLKYQTIKLSLFTFVSPSSEDIYLRFAASYKLSDPVELIAGANVFGGAHHQTLFGQLEDNDNVYIRARYSF